MTSRGAACGGRWGSPHTVNEAQDRKARGLNAEGETDTTELQ